MMIMCPPSARSRHSSTSVAPLTLLPQPAALLLRLWMVSHGNPKDLHSLKTARTKVLLLLQLVILLDLDTF